MKYNHTSVYKIRGIAPLADDGERELLVDDKRGLRAVLTNQPDGWTLQADRSLVVAGLLLGGIPGTKTSTDIEEAIAPEIMNLRESRRQSSGGCLYLAISINGDIEDFAPRSQREFDNFVVTLDGPPLKEPIREASEPSITAIIAAVALASESIISVEKASDSIIFVRDDGKAIYSYTFSMGGISIYTSQPVTAGMVDCVNGWYPKLVGNTALQRVIRLLTTSFMSKSDRLRAFLGAWTALEILVNKIFPQYEAQFYESLKESRPAAHEQCLVRMRKVMGGKYPLLDKFGIIACQLAPHDADKDVSTFEEAKKIRDYLLHGQDVTESSLPVTSIQALIRDYLCLHLGESRTP